MRGRKGILGFFLVAGIGFCVAGVVAFGMGGMGGGIVGSTFLLIGVIWVLVALVVLGMYGRMARKRSDEKELFRTGQRAMATIESVSTTGTVLNHINVQIDLRLRVTPRSGAEFMHERRMYVPTFAVPRPGDQIEVSYDPADTSKVALNFDERADTAGGMQLITQAPGAGAMPAGMQPAARPAPVPPPPPPGAAVPPPPPPGAVGPDPGVDNVIASLERLQKLREQGVLDEAEFQAQKDRLLG